MTEVRSPGLADVVELAVDRALLDLRVSLPGVVLEFDATEQRAKVQPITRQTYLDEEGEEHTAKLPAISNVPVIFPGGGGFRQTFPIAVGDHVWLIFSDAGLDKYLTNGGADVDPVSLHSHELTDAVCFPGLHPFSAPWKGSSSSDMTLGKDGGPQVVLKASEVHLGADASTPATEAVIKGAAFLAGLSAVLSSISSFIGAAGSQLGTLTPAGIASIAAATSIGTFQAGAAAYLSTIVKVK